MDSIPTEENYLIKKAKLTQTTNPHQAKSWILAAKTLYPNNFGVQFEAYCLEKMANNYEEAAKCFSYIVLTFKTLPADIWNEVCQLTSALRIPEGGTTEKQEFFVKMFQHISYDVQHKILLLTANHSDNNMEHCKLILLLLRRFPQAIQTHSPRLLETLVQGIAANHLHFREMLLLEAVPLIMFKPPELPAAIVNRIMSIAFEYYVNLMFKVDVTGEPGTNALGEYWTKIFETLDLCGRILKWETFLPYNRMTSTNLYWERLIQIVSSAPPRPSENKQILFCATLLFVLALQEYMYNIKVRVDDADTEYILLEGFRIDNGASPWGTTETPMEAPHISVFSPCTPETPICLVTAAHCWQLLHSNEILKMDFSQLLMTVPLSGWINRFLVDLAFYLGRSEEAHSILKDTKCSEIETNLRLLSLTGVHPAVFNDQSFEYMLKILNDLPPSTGTLVNPLSHGMARRHLILLPLTKRAVIQYCTKVIVNMLKHKVQTEGENCTDVELGNLLVLLQLNWPQEMSLAELVFKIIQNKGQFCYTPFCIYIVCPDMIEQFMSMWFPHGGDINLEFTAPIGTSTIGSRRIGTRGADKGVKDDFKMLMKQQMLKCNEAVETIIQQFIQQENKTLLQGLLKK